VQFALALATCVLAQPLAEAPARHARMTLYYIPFAAETYVAVTEKTIKKSAYHTIEVDSPERIAALEAVLADRKGKGRFNRSSVRLLVVPRSPATADILVDSEGRVSEGGVTSALSTEAFTSLKRILSELTAEPRTSHPEVIRRAKAIPVSALDPRLPELRLEDCVKELIGPRTRVEWRTGDYPCERRRTRSGTSSFRNYLKWPAERTAD